MAMTTDARTRTVELNSPAGTTSGLASAFARKDPVVRRGERNPNCDMQFSCDGEYAFIGIRVPLNDIRNFTGFNDFTGELELTKSDHALISSSGLVLANDKMQSDDERGWDAVWTRFGFPRGEEPLVTASFQMMMMSSEWNPNKNVR
jgi:hypothetical protein